MVWHSQRACNSLAHFFENAFRSRSGTRLVPCPWRCLLFGICLGRLETNACLFRSAFLHSRTYMKVSFKPWRQLMFSARAITELLCLASAAVTSDYLNRRRRILAHFCSALWTWYVKREPTMASSGLPLWMPSAPLQPAYYSSLWSFDAWRPGLMGRTAEHLWNRFLLPMLPIEVPDYFGEGVLKTTCITSASRPVGAGFSNLETLAILLTFGVRPEYAPS